MVNKNIHVLSRAVIIDQGHLLVCQTLDLPNNFYFLPGGHVEHGESAEQTVLRELVEECGSVCTIKRFLGCLEYSFDLDTAVSAIITNIISFLKQNQKS